MTRAFILVDQPLQAELLDNFCFIQCFLLILFIGDPENTLRQVSPTPGSLLGVYEEEYCTLLTSVQAFPKQTGD